MDRVAIIILNWNSTKNTLNCLKSLATLTYQNCEVIIIDNGSLPSEIETLKKKLPPKVNLIANNKNYGFAKGNNQGIYYAIEKFHPDYILLLNSDTVVTPSLLEPLISLMHKDPEISTVQPKILKMYNISVLDSAGQTAYSYGSTRDIGIGKLDAQEFQQRREIFGACSACALYRISSLKKTGLFDEALFSLFEDVDLSWRLRLKGYKILYEPAAAVHHKRGISQPSLNDINTKSVRALRRFYGFRNCLIITIKYYPIYYIVKFLPIHLYRLIIGLFYKIRFRFKAHFFKAIFTAIKSRRVIQRRPLIGKVRKRWIIDIGYQDLLFKKYENITYLQ